MIQKNNKNNMESVSPENKSTEVVMMQIGNQFDTKGGIALVCKYENLNLFSHTDMRDKDVLEIGCGVLPACFGVEDSQMPRKYVATDTTEQLIKTARLVDARPGYRVESGLEPSFEDKSFDLIILRGVLHHLPYPTHALETFRRLLRGGGAPFI